MAKIRRALKSGDLENAAQICEGTQAPFSNVVYSGLEHHGRSREEISNAMEREIAMETTELERYTSIVATIGNTAVYIGLFGTVLGIIRAFHDISVAGVGGMGSGTGSGIGSGTGGYPVGGVPWGSPQGSSAWNSKWDDYYSMVWAKIKAQWTLPEDFQKGKTELESIIVMIIGRDGKVQKSWFENRSGNALYDQMAMRAIMKAEPLPPIPKEFSDHTVEIAIRFHPD